MNGNNEIEDGMGFAGLVPTREEERQERRIKNMEAALHAYRIEAQDLRAKLASEQLRRESAEKVVDGVNKGTGHWLLTEEDAERYRLLYPKDSKDMNNG